MRNTRRRWVAAAVVIGILLPGLAHADRRRARRQVPPEVQAEILRRAQARAARKTTLDAAVLQLQTGLAPSAGPTAAAAEGESDQPFIARSPSGHVRALVAPQGRSWAASRSGEPATAEARALAFLTENRAVFGWAGSRSTLQTSRWRAQGGRSFVHVEQRVDGLRVFGAAAVVQVEASGGVSFVLAHLARDGARFYEPGFVTVPVLDAARAAEAARGALPADRQPADLAAETPELMVYEPSVIGNDGASRLVWYVRVRSAAAIVNEVVLVDAATGAVAFHYSDVKEAKNRSIYDANNVSGSLGGPTPARTEGQGPTGNSNVDSAYQYMGDTYDFYFSFFGRDSWDGAGGPLIGRVRYCDASTGCPMQNAFWNGSEMRFGDGYAVDDVTGHEITHGVTQTESNLIYWGEPGAINESLSDIFGEFVDQTYEAPAVRWEIGDDLPGGPIRDMSNPPLFFQPDRRFSPLWFFDSTDNRGVHENSGVGNKLAYLLTDGATFNGQVVTGQGLTQVAHLFYEAQIHLLVPSSDYIDLYVALRQAANNIGWDANQEAALEAGALAVEIAVQGATVDIFDDGFEGPFPGSWDVFSAPDIVFGIDAHTQWGKSSYRKASGSFSAYCAAGGPSAVPPGGPYNPFMNTWMIYGPFPLSSASAAWAEFDTYIDVEPGFGDDIFWGVSTDGNAFDGFLVQPDPPGTSLTPAQFVHEVFNFNDVASSTPTLGQPQVWFAFNFESDEIVEQEGVYIDNVQIRNVVPQTSDLSITKSDGSSTALAGQPVTYTIQVSNAGPNAVTNARVQDAFPASLTGATWTCTATAGSSCAAASGTGNIDRLVSLLNGGTATFTATATLNPAATGTLVNTATVTAPAGWTDPNLANNSATDTDTIALPADVSVTKTDGSSTATAGSPVTYTIVVSNAGPNAVSGVTVTDNVPPALLTPTWTCTPGGGATCTASGSGNIADSVNLPVGGTATYSLTGTLSATAASLSNTATASLPAGYGDPNPANNTATDTDLLMCSSSQTSLIPDGRVSSITIAGFATQWLVFGTHAGYSYSLDVSNAFTASAPSSFVLYRGDDGCTNASSAVFRLTAGIDPEATGNTARLAFTATGSDPNYRLQMTNTSGAPTTYNFVLGETTLFSPAWSTNGTYNTYYSFQNTTSATINATITLTRGDGTSAGSATLAIPPGVTASTNTVALGTVRNAVGTARVTHDGPPGALLPESDIANFSLTPAYVQPVRFRSVRETR